MDKQAVCIKALEWEQRKQVTFSAAQHPDPDPDTKMKAALTLCCLLVPAVLALKVTVEEELSRGEERAAAPGRGGNKFFWCQLYQPNCVDGCSSRDRKWMSDHCSLQFSFSRD